MFNTQDRRRHKGLLFVIYYMRFHVILFSTLASLMAAFIPVALGVGNGLIPNDAMRASSVLDRYHIPSQARLNNTKQGKSGGAWKPKVSDKKQYLDVDLGALTNVSQVGVCCCGAVLTYLIYRDFSGQKVWKLESLLPCKIKNM